MRDIQLWKEFNVNQLTPVYSLYIDGKPASVCFSMEIVEDLRRFHPAIDAEKEILDMLKAEMNYQMTDIQFGLTQQEVDKIIDLIKEKLKNE